MNVADPTLLVASGFDPATREFRYQVNPRFGQRPGESAWHAPAELRITARMSIGPSLTTQQNRTLARRARASREDARSRAFMLPIGNPFADILDFNEELRLTPQQEDSLSAMEGRWRQAIYTVQTSLTKYIGQISDSVPDGEIAPHVRSAQKRIAAISRSWIPPIRELLTDAQLERAPRDVRSWVGSPGPMDDGVSLGP